ncbi:MAG: hypothetical protein COX29_00985 [Candidatus Moranbacteria bacterium CG23_combo_of_CG06-09_8_20_14_all_35_22]|nr:MAG: hypothetical protein COX29_00985 [Candidatus Moranbacteria bacterium CG23_combo_of_CG06-09_8_20_14_all_35_22]
MEVKYVPQFLKELKKIKDNETKLFIWAKIEIIEKSGLYQMQITHDATYIKNYALYEVRVGKKSRNYRILCAIKNNYCWLLHLFFKKTQQIELREFKTALSRKNFI